MNRQEALDTIARYLPPDLRAQVIEALSTRDEDETPEDWQPRASFDWKAIEAQARERGITVRQRIATDVSAMQDSDEDEDEDDELPDWKAIEAQAKADLEQIKTDLNAYHFMERYFSRELAGQYSAIYRSLRKEMGKTPRQAIDTILSLPPL